MPPDSTTASAPTSTKSTLHHAYCVSATEQALTKETQKPLKETLQVEKILKRGSI
jgi:hypothetical protein